MKTLFILFVAITLFFCVHHDAIAEEIKVGGGGAALDGVIKPVKEHFEKATGITIKLVYSNDILSYKNLLAGTIDASTFGGSFDEFEKLIIKNGATFSKQSDYTVTQIGKARIHTVVNKNNPIQKLSKEQLNGIFTGKISNWKEVGGTDSVILVVLSQTNIATNNAFQKAVLDGKPLLSEYLDSSSFKDMANIVANNPDSIAFGPLSLLDAGAVKDVEIPGFFRPINLLTKGKISVPIKKMAEYIATEGSKFIKE
jgi:phosphate transport system substrate-binding protein